MGLSRGESWVHARVSCGSRPGRVASPCHGQGEVQVQGNFGCSRILAVARQVRPDMRSGTSAPTTFMRACVWKIKPAHTSGENTDGQIMGELEEKQAQTKEDADEDGQYFEYSVKTHCLHVSSGAIHKYGTIEGCPACMTIERRAHMTGRIGCNQSNACRERIRSEMQTEPEYRRLMHKHEPHHEAGHIEVLTEAQISER